MNQDSSPKNSIDLVAARAKLERDGGKRFWQSLEELSDTKEYREFPSITSSRRMRRKTAGSIAATC